MGVNNGCSAFPLPMGTDTVSGTEGMTLRDYFAGQALAGLSSSQDENGNWMYGDAETVAKESYLIADAMIEARNNG